MHSGISKRGTVLILMFESKALELFDLQYKGEAFHPYHIYGVIPLKTAVFAWLLAKPCLLAQHLHCFQ